MKRMLINATQAEERRLAIVDGQRLLDYEIEIEGREQRKGNIYKGVVTRVEPSLEACFVDYGEDRHGFLPFKEISKQYFSQNVSPSQAKIQEVIKSGQEILVQVEKEERGNKGAALTSFVSIAGRYVVLMPNNPRGGGVSRRIEGEDRAELKDALDQLQYPNGMSIIARTAGIGRSAEELQWDLNYLLKLWGAVDEAAKAQGGAFLIYQESSLVIRAIRDYFNADIGDILIDTDDIYEQAQQFMAHVMPEHAARVKRYRDDVPLFSRFQIEHQIESAYSRTVQLPSGGAIVIDHTEALVSVDVNSARSIRGGDIEETATRTNLEAAEEVARQMRLRDLGGLIVIDFIDMDESRNRRDVETRLRDSLRQDRARVQFGTISKFGLMEMSRQRLRPALSEGASVPCPRCGGSGHIRDTESSALQILRIIQEESVKDGTAAVHAQVPVEVAAFLLNEKRTEIAKIEIKQRIQVLMVPNKHLETPNYKLERMKVDDPRLDRMEASYKMVDDEVQSEEVTRRSQEPTNKQQPVIKGVLPDQPAPVAAAPAAPAAPAAVNVAASAAQTSGFLAWLKGLFGMGGGTDSTNKTTAIDTKSAGRTGGKGGSSERSERGGRGRNEREGREGREGRNSRGKDGRTTRDTNREGREPREGRKEPRADRNSRGQRSDASDTLSGAPIGATEAVVGNPPTENRNERGGRGGRDRGERGGRQAREGGRDGGRESGREQNAERQVDSATSATSSTQAAGVATSAPLDPAISAAAAAALAVMNAAQGAHEARAAEQNKHNAASNAEAPSQDAPATESHDVSASNDDRNADDRSSEGRESRENRPRRSRDRYGRDRRERNDRGDQGEQTERNSHAVVAENSHSDGFSAASTSASAAPIPASASTTTGSDATANTAAVALPKVTQYNLDLQNLQQVSTASGLNWVQSNSESVAKVQAQIASEVKPTHTPRERPAAVAQSQEALVMVETKRDLG